MDMQALMKQAQELQDKVAKAQEELGAARVKGIAGNGLVIVEMNGKYDLIKLTLAPDLLKEDLETITALVTAAFNDAKAKTDDLIDKTMSAATAGMPLPM
ncbi:MAG: YbaB/EbfC family nucleoid-associated protein [Rickettsiales bacterium]|jgi:DNA-binding YbaB/EbfC family protein|nr:YbaB/EbfC family nucleoid-associated protein [Rickettsiales bacterium]